MLAVVARHADVWHAWMDAETLAHKGAVLDRHCERLDRDPAAIARATGGTIDHGSEQSPTQALERLDQLGREMLAHLA